ncbi:hypothetical protein KL86DES1_21471 [uncultured Desulfovibrio sp.]|uniref:Uncharacterized protein n=1 Tax=uncultured Desulfovibrio sp. TaxID=167968 RepID=A0A212L873_9BACT|nr:hypothetical protein KL86DES1_21471 [uncultured Desulfovibrio sp.]VZH34369.1 conserved protein of unknown function [Desulfovibrio sp. 86]
MYYNMLKLNIILDSSVLVAPKVAPFFIRCGTGESVADAAPSIRVVCNRALCPSTIQILPVS